VDPRLASRLGDRFFPDIVALQEGTTTQDSVGEPIITWVTKHTVKCRFALEPVVQGSRRSSESAPVIFGTHRAMLVGEFQDVRPDTWQALINGVPYDIKAVDWNEGFTSLVMDQQIPVAVNA